MRFATLAVLWLVATASAQVPVPIQEGQYDLGDAKSFKVLYAGKPGCDREAHFLAFLRASFAKVDAIALDQLTQSAAAPYDIVVADWQRLYGRGENIKIDIPRLVVAQGFTKPIVMLGAVGGSIATHTKIGWL